MAAPNPPIFVRGLSRSGGTLLTTILDSHPLVAMSYELYPNLLISKDGHRIDIQEFYNSLRQGKKLEGKLPISLSPTWQSGLFHFLQGVAARVGVKKSNNHWAAQLGEPNLRSFYVRLQRGGIERENLLNLLSVYIQEGYTWDSCQGRLKFIERCASLKMTRQGKKIWGLKISNSFEDYYSVWPDAYYVLILRDGRDVLVSQLKKGAFNKSPEEVAKGWVSTVASFQIFASRPGIKSCIVRYEELVRNPESEVRHLCDFLNIDFEPSMLNFYQKDLTIYDATHLSMDRISKPIDSNQIGRWKRELKPEQLEGFLSVAKDEMQKQGYLD